ncbi:hypothetical protein G7054_g1594 [Neopestalotiopsis clavispora]|nr:hypothetical protein G7054_g1594 [Neopestalotiopsis clavispora]
MLKKSFLGPGKPIQRGITTCCLIAIILFGYDQGVFGGILQNEDWLDLFNHPSDIETGIIVSCYNLGCLVGCLGCFSLGDKLGRRRTIWLAMGIVIIGAILQASAFTVPALVIGRIITGVGTGLKTSTVPMYQAELCEAKSRGRLVSAEVLFVGVGIVLAYWLDFGLSFVGGSIAWRLPLALQILFALLVICLVFALPEPPRWLLNHGREQEATEALCSVHDKGSTDAWIVAEKNAIIQAIELEAMGGEHAESAAPVRTHYRMFLAWLIQFMNQAGGINLVVYYAPTVLVQNVGTTARMAQILGGCINLMFMIGSILPSLTLDRMGRRKTMIFGCSGLSICMLLISVLLSRNGHQNGETSASAAVAFFFLYMLIFGMSVNCVPWVYAPEILPLRARTRGAAVATSSNWLHFYSYSFALKGDWSTTYPGRQELHDYFASVADRFAILPHCKFNSKCLSMTWDELTSLWTCTFQNELTGEIFTHTAAVVVSAIGTLDRPARWKGDVDFKGKSIVVLGNGASATQFVPELVKEVRPHGRVVQLVKSAHWWTKRGNDKYSGVWKMIMSYVPLAARLYRIVLAWQLESVFYSFLMNDNGARIRQQIRDATYQYIENDAPAEYKEILKPDYEPGCKRRVNTIHIEAGSIVTESGAEYPADMIIYATGFMTQKWLYPMQIQGVGGKSLHDVWDASGGAEAYKGTVVAGFPNFFILYDQILLPPLTPVLTSGAKSIRVKPEAQRRDLTWVHSKLQNLVFNSGCQSWWMDPNTKKNTFIYPDPMYKYWLRTIFPVWSDFEVTGAPYRDSWTKKVAVISSIGVAALVVNSAVEKGAFMASIQEWATQMAALVR